MFRTVLTLPFTILATSANADFIKLTGVTTDSDRNAIHAAAIDLFGCTRLDYAIHYGTVTADPNALEANQTAVLEGRRSVIESEKVLARLQSNTDDSVWVALNSKRSDPSCAK